MGMTGEINRPGSSGPDAHRLSPPATAHRVGRS